MKSTTLTIAGVALAALALNIAPAARAQDGGGWTVAKAMASDKLDFTKLNNSTYDYADISMAKGDRLSDTQVAKILKIARHSGQRFKDVLAAVNRGETFAVLAAKNGVAYSSLRDVDAEKDEIAAFESAYLATGMPSVRRNTVDKILMR